MGHKKRKIRNRKVKRQKLVTIFCILVLTALLSVGYAAFSAIISMTAKGNTKIMYATTTLKKLLRNNSLTMFTDPFGNIRYTGADEDVHNYVCIADEDPCQDKHLFRIIGSFLNIDDGNGKLETRLKVVKATKYVEDYWDSARSNNWARPATLNTTLNTTYYTSLESSVQDVIGLTTWNIGGIPNSSSNVITSNLAYTSERGSNTNLNNVAPSTWIGKVALIYPSDYGYASKECYLDKPLVAENGDDYSSDICKNSNWLFLNDQFFLSPANTCSRGVSLIDNGKYHECKAVDGFSINVRPSFYLKSNVFLITNNNDGTSINPYIVKLSND